jgi:glycosyltransferase involved in cell wall biosynthesis
VRKALDAMDASGVQISFVVYDLLPMLLPKYFPTSKPFSTWLSFVARQEHLICISRAVADELRAHLDKQLPCDGPMPRISWFHLGADIENSVPSRDLPADMAAQIERLRSRPTFLMVGTVEPRKGHALVLSAFERFWSKNGDANLVIVGKQGWMVEALCERLRAHPEYKGRLIWLDSVSDAHLQRLYQSCDCLIAASEGEGFGLPLIEAAKYDLPILARDLPVFREVAGEHATYFDGSDPDTLLGALEDWLAAHRAGHTVRSGGLPFLTWRESAAALLRNIGIDSAE